MNQWAIRGVSYFQNSLNSTTEDQFWYEFGELLLADCVPTQILSTIDNVTDESEATDRIAAWMNEYNDHGNIKGRLGYYEEVINEKETEH